MTILHLQKTIRKTWHPLRYQEWYLDIEDFEQLKEAE
jgi:hypothetical protein